MYVEGVCILFLTCVVFVPELCSYAICWLTFLPFFGFSILQF